MNKNKFYNGNPSIKRAGVKQKYTQHQLDEFKHCQSDPIYFIENYCIINTIDFGKQLFKPYDYQKRMVEAFQGNRFVINLLPRQTGKTTVVAAYLLWYVTFHADKEVGILANKAATSREILDRIKLMLENLPFWLQMGVTEYNKGNVDFGNNSKLMAFATSSDSVRGRSFSLIYLDEFAFVEGADAFYTSTYPVISSGKTSKVIITSTPNGMNLFYKLWMDAKQGKSQFFPLEVLWDEHPDRDEQWRIEQIKNIGKKQFSQEFSCSFFGSSGTLIDGDIQARLVWNEPIIDTENLKIYEKPIEGHSYVLTVDVSEGAASDFSVINITDITKPPYRQVGVWRNNRTSPIILPEIIYPMAKEYNDAYVLVETNSIGSQVGTSLYYDYEYENTIITNVKNGDNVISSGFGNRIDFGVRTTVKSKRIGCSNIKTLIENDLYILNDFETIQELQTFSRKGKSYEAEDGKFDDIVMTLVIFGWLSYQDYFIDLTNVNAREFIIRKNEQTIENELTPFGFVNNAIDEYQSSDQNEVLEDFSLLG